MSAIAFPRAVLSQALNVIWARFSFAVLMVVTFVLYMSGLDRNGWANAYYAAAVEAGATTWKAFCFGSLDASNFITVDKSPAFLWVMEISARLFGFNEWSVLVPQALEGVATVALVFVAVRRWFGSAAGLIAGAVVALTPVAALMFRYNNPDALLVLLLTGGAYATLRAVESGSTRWLVLAAALIGTGFLAKMLQAFVVVPVVVLIYLALGRPRLLRRLKQLVIAGFALVLASGWWVAVVELWPSADRPYIGGSQNNSLLNLIFGYNGVGRITGNEVGSVGGLGAVVSRWGLTGWSRLFLNEFGGQISWLIPAALILMAAGLWITLRAQRSDLARASYLMWGGYLLITGAVFSFAQGIIHPYYSIALAPAIGALVGAGSVELWKRRSSWIARLFLASALAATPLWAFVLLGRRRHLSKRKPARSAADVAARGRRRALSLGCGNDRRQFGGGLRAGNGQACDGHRRVQRVRPCTDPGPVRELREPGTDSLRHRGRNPRGERLEQRDRGLGEPAFHRHDRGRRNGLRPDPAGLLVAQQPECLEALAEARLEAVVKPAHWRGGPRFADPQHVQRRFDCQREPDFTHGTDQRVKPVLGGARGVQVASYEFVVDAHHPIRCDVAGAADRSSSAHRKRREKHRVAAGEDSESGDVSRRDA